MILARFAVVVTSVGLVVGVVFCFGLLLLLGWGWLVRGGGCGCWVRWWLVPIRVRGLGPIGRWVGLVGRFVGIGWVCLGLLLW